MKLTLIAEVPPPPPPDLSIPSLFTISKELFIMLFT